MQESASFFNRLDDKQKEHIIRAGYDAIVPHLGDEAKYAPYEQVRDDCFEYFRTGAVPHRNSPPKPHHFAAIPHAHAQPLVLAAVKMDRCTEMKIRVAIDVVSLLIGICGIGYGVAKPAAVELVNGIPAAGIEAIVAAFSSASSSWDYCVAVGNVGGSILKYCNIGTMLQALQKHMKWYDWVITSVTLAGTITAMFASGGLAMAADIAVNVAGIAQLTEDVIAMRSACGMK